MNVAGKVSWFGGPGDPTDSGHTANGETTKTPGIAVYNHGTLNGYWRVKAPNGKTVVLKQTDIGPAPWTGRKIDVTYSALKDFGYGEHNFPTDSHFSAEYLGRKPPKEAAVQSPPQRVEPTSAATLPGLSFDKAGYEQAQRSALLGKLLSSEGGQKDNPLFSTGLVTTKPAERSEYEHEVPAGEKVAEHQGAPIVKATEGPHAGKTVFVPQGKVANSGGQAGFTPGAGTVYDKGALPAISRNLDALGKALGIKLTGISGYRTPQHSVAVGGFADDPHTKALASDTPGIEKVPKAVLNKFGLERPFPGAKEADHIQLLHSVNRNGGY